MSNSQIRIQGERGEQSPFVLLVVDDPGAAHLLRLAFNEFGESAEIQNPTSRQRALQILDVGTDVGTVRPDAVVLDTETLAVDELELLREIRETVSDDPPAVVILSGNDDPDVVRKSYERGATAYLVKPDDYEGLADVVADVNTLIETSDGEVGVSQEVE